VPLTLPLSPGGERSSQVKLPWASLPFPSPLGGEGWGEGDKILDHWDFGHYLIIGAWKFVIYQIAFS